MTKIGYQEYTARTRAILEKEKEELSPRSSEKEVKKEIKKEEPGLLDLRKRK